MSDHFRKYTNQRCILTVMLFLFCASCGAQDSDLRIRTKSGLHHIRTATNENVGEWWSLWDKRTFVTGVAEPSDLPVDNALSYFRQSLAQAMASDLLSESVHDASRLRFIEDVFNEEISMERQSLLSDPPSDGAMEKASAQFNAESSLQVAHYFIKLNTMESALRRISAAGFQHAEKWIGAGASPLMTAQWMTLLQKAQGVLWVEPNLVSELPRLPRTPSDAGSLGLSGEFKYNTSIVSVLKRIRADTAFTFVERTRPTLSSVTVAILDTGVDSAHPELKDQMFVNPAEKEDGVDNDNNCFVDDVHGIDATVECGRDDGAAPRPRHSDLGGAGKQCPRLRPDDELSANCGHGTHVAGIVAAKHGGDLSTIGVCPSCKILSVRVAERCLQPDTKNAGECRRPMTAFDPLTSYEVDGGISDTSQIRALTYLYNLRAPDNRNRLLVNVINLSLGKYFASRSMSYIIRNLQRKNIIVVAAAGNDGTESPSYPAAYDSVVAVCATSEDYAKGIYGRAPFSNFGDWVDVCAPGTDIVSTIPGKTFDGGGLFVDKSGTSQATPLVAGALGYLLSYYGNEKSAAQIVEMLKRGADSESLYNAPDNRVPGTGERLYRACYADTSNCDNLLGAGFLDLDAAMQGKSQSKTNRNFLSNQPGGCVVSDLAKAQIAGTSFHWTLLTSSMPFLLLLFYIFLVLLRCISRIGHVGRNGR
ncbi:MAG: hypothetical protein RIR26_308 [Pseudomonadota bacterium]